MNQNQLRDAFEAWTQTQPHGKYPLKRDGEGQYWADGTEVAWDAWQGALSQPAQEGEWAEPVWIVNDLGELGVKANGRFFFLYKGDNLEYHTVSEVKNGVVMHGDHDPMQYRIVGKREFGEVCHPVTQLRVVNGYIHDMTPRRYTQELVYTPGLSDGSPNDGLWRDLPAPRTTQPASQSWRDTLTVNLMRYSGDLTKAQIRELIDAAVSGLSPDEALFTPASQEQEQHPTPAAVPESGEPKPVTKNDHPEHHMTWSPLELRWITARDAQWQALRTAGAVPEVSNEQIDIAFEKLIGYVLLPKDARKAVRSLLAASPAPKDGGEVPGPFAKRCYAMSEPHLSGYRLIVGFERLADVQEAHIFVANQARAAMSAAQAGGGE